MKSAKGAGFRVAPGFQQQNQDFGKDSGAAQRVDERSVSLTVALGTIKGVEERLVEVGQTEKVLDAAWSVSVDGSEQFVHVIVYVQGGG